MKLETSEEERAEFRKWFEDRSLSIIPRSFVPDSIWAHALRLLRDIDTLLAEVERLRKEYELAGEQLDELEAEAEASTVEIANLRAELDRAPLLPAEVEEMRKVLLAWAGDYNLQDESCLPDDLRSAASLLSRWPGGWRPMETSMKTFTMYRRNVPTDTHDENQRNAPDQPQFEGVVFSDGSVAIRWLTAKRSTAIWASMDDMLAIHGHPEYGSELVWSPLPGDRP